MSKQTRGILKEYYRTLPTHSAAVQGTNTNQRTVHDRREVTSILRAIDKLESEGAQRYVESGGLFKGE
ncbi:MAG: hypothetical protein ABFQ89_01670 [Chloroflexota bacterium]